MSHKENIVCKEYIGSGFFAEGKANKAREEANCKYEKEKENKIKQAGIQANFKMFEKLFNILDSNLDLAILIEPSQSIRENQDYKEYDEQLLKSYISKSKNNNIYITNFNVDKETLTECQEYSYYTASVETKSESYATGSYSGSIDSNGNISISSDTTTSIDYYLVTKEVTGSLKRVLHYKIIKVEDVQKVKNKEKDYAPLYIKHNNYSIYRNNLKKPVKKIDCNINSAFHLITTICALLFSIYTIISILFSYFRIYQVGNVNIYLDLKNFTLNIYFIIPVLITFILEFAALVVFTVFNKKFDYTRRMLVENKFCTFRTDTAVSYRWNADGSMKIACILSLVSLVINLIAIMLSIMDSLSCNIISSILVLISFIMSIMIFILSILVVKLNNNFENWKKFVSGMDNFKNSGNLEISDKLVAEIKKYTVHQNIS